MSLLCAVGSKNAALIAEQPPLWVREAAWREDAKLALADLDCLNASQRRAVAKAMVGALIQNQSSWSCFFIFSFISSSALKLNVPLPSLFPLCSR